MRFNPNTPRLVILRGNEQIVTNRPLHQMVTKILLDEAVKLGYSGTKLPAAGLPAMDIQGVRVWVDPLPDVQIKKDRYGQTRQFRPFTLRVQSQCPHCGWRGAFGRFHQHTCKE